MICLQSCARRVNCFVGIQALVNIGELPGAADDRHYLAIREPRRFSLITSFTMLGMLMAFSHRNAYDARGGRDRARARAVDRFEAVNEHRHAGKQRRRRFGFRPRPEREAAAERRFFLADADRGIFVVADGVGGADAGEVASQTAVDV